MKSKEFRSGISGLSEKTSDRILSCIDKVNPVFIPHSGSNVLAYKAKEAGYEVYATDPLFYNRCIIEGVLANNSPIEDIFPDFETIESLRYQGWWQTHGEGELTETLRSWVDKVAYFNKNNPFQLAVLGKMILTFSHLGLGATFFKRRKKIRNPEDNPFAGIMTTPRHRMKQLDTEDLIQHFYNTTNYFNQFRIPGNLKLGIPDFCTLIDTAEIWQESQWTKVGSILKQKQEVVIHEEANTEVRRLIKVVPWKKRAGVKEFLSSKYRKVEEHFSETSSFVQEILYDCE